MCLIQRDRLYLKHSSDGLFTNYLAWSKRQVHGRSGCTVCVSTLQSSKLECNETKPYTELSFGLQVDNKKNSCNTNDTLLKNNVYHTYMAGLDPIKN